jgi:hypothetical protein
MIDRLAAHAPPGLLYSASFVSAIAPWQENIEWAVKIISALSCIGFSLAGYLVTRRRSRRDRD